MTIDLGDLHPATVKAIQGGLVDLQSIADDLSESDLYDAERELTSLAEGFARRAGYIHERQLGSDHHRAVKRSNTVATAIRQSLGFAYPKQDLSF